MCIATYTVTVYCDGNNLTATQHCCMIIVNKSFMYFVPKSVHAANVCSNVFYLYVLQQSGQGLIGIPTGYKNIRGQ